MLPLGRPVYLSDVSQIERRVLPHDFRKPEWILSFSLSMREAAQPSCALQPSRATPAVPSRKEKGEGWNSYFFSSNPFGLLSLASLVCSIIMVPTGSAPTPVNRPAGRPSVEIVNGDSYARQISFLFPSFVFSLSLGEIYLPRKSTGGTMNSISFHEKKKDGRKKDTGRKGKNLQSETFLSFVLRLSRPLRIL